jgi:dihydrodipicolinate synthase/N-acetylneuraminate lyase
MAELRGTYAASVTPLTGGGAAVDEEAVRPLVDFLVAGGVDGVLPLGTTGEGILLSGAERRRVTELFVEAVDGRIGIIVHCGAQTTAETAALATHAAAAGADGVAVIGPPYFAYDDRALVGHFAAAAAACAPLPFYLYAFTARSGYEIPLDVVAGLRERAPNLAGLKVSETPWERFEPYVIEGLDVFVGPEALIHRGLEAGAVGAVSALASAFPDLVTAAVREPSAAAAERLGELRVRIQRFPLQSALKTVLAGYGVPVRPDVRAPLRTLDAAERRELAESLQPTAAASR